jgi:hypothetical protein
MTVGQWWKGAPGAIDETCTGLSWKAGNVRVHLQIVEEAEALTPGILIPVTV